VAPSLPSQYNPLPVGRICLKTPVGLLMVCVAVHFLKSKGGSGFFSGLQYFDDRKRPPKDNLLKALCLGRSIQPAWTLEKIDVKAMKIAAVAEVEKYILCIECC